MARNNYSLGLVLIVLAVILILGKVGVIGFLGSMLWPIFILLPGIAFHMLFFSRILPVGVLVPGGMLITYSLMFFYCNVFGWSSMSYLWPGFTFGVAVGLYELHIFNQSGTRGKPTAAIIVALISLVFFVFAFLASVSIYVIALILIGAGVAVMLRRKRSW